MSEHSDDLTSLADEHALGLLPETEAALFEEIMSRDAALAARVGLLRDQLLPLDRSAAPVSIPAGFAARLYERLAAEGQSGRTTAVASAEPRRVVAAAPRRRAWSMSAGRMAASIVGLVVGLAAGLAVGWLQPAPEPVVIAVLLDAQGVPTAVIEDFGDARAQVRFVADVDVPPGRTMQAWTLPSPELGPTSLGVLDGVEATLLLGPDLPPPTQRQLYEITLEPAGGSPTGRPSGPILGVGYAALQD